MPTAIEEKIIRSALWAAYGDILGFPSELLSAAEFERRRSKNKITEPIAWKKRQGGLFGAEIEFKPGCYSDDTQLRLSTCRAIRGNGYFDVESFAKIELPVWLSYALGAGRGTKAAAGNLALKETTWSQNFFSTDRSTYWNGGGNGAAMRIQPHVWANYKKGISSFLPDVVRNSICTHGHPRAIIGAAIHASLLLHSINNKAPADPKDWDSLGSDAASVAYESILEDEELSLIWIPKWEIASGKKLKEVWGTTIAEWVGAAQWAMSKCRNISNREELYHLILRELGGFSNEERGSGLKTCLFASILAWLYKDDDPVAALLLSANTFKSDTDTIASMAGAIIGVNAQTNPATTIQDEQYIREEALRLARIAEGARETSFNYPDLMCWSAPKAQGDTWIADEKLGEISGLGKLISIGKEFTPRKDSKYLWQWCELEFGQTILAKRRNYTIEATSPQLSSTYEPTEPSHLIETICKAPLEKKELPHRPTINELTQSCIKSGFDPLTIGKALMYLAQGEDGIEKAIAFSAIIAKAKITRDSKIS